MKLLKRVLQGKIPVWDFSQVKDFLVVRKGMSREEVDALEVEYLRWFKLTVDNPGRKIPCSKKVDEFWHAHVLHTRDYAKFCETHAGNFVHHDPIIEASELSALEPDYTDGTLKLYRELYGDPEARFWGTNEQICFPSCDNGVTTR